MLQKDNLFKSQVYVAHSFWVIWQNIPRIIRALQVRLDSSNNMDSHINTRQKHNNFI